MGESQISYYTYHIFSIKCPGVYFKMGLVDLTLSWSQRLIGSQCLFMKICNFFESFGDDYYQKIDEDKCQPLPIKLCSSLCFFVKHGGNISAKVKQESYQASLQLGTYSGLEVPVACITKFTVGYPLRKDNSWQD